MRYLIAIIFLLGSNLLFCEAFFLRCSVSGTGAEWYPGNNIKKSDAGIISKDWVVTIIPDEVKKDTIRTAKVTFTYGEKSEDFRKNMSGDVYTGLFLIDEDDYKVLIISHPPQKFEIYTIYPSRKCGFLTVSKYFLGMPILKALYDIDKNDVRLKDIPFGSVDTFPLTYL